MIWGSDTCDCVVICERPSKNGTYKHRCRIHLTSRNTTDVYQYNLQHRKRSTESDDQARQRKNNVRKDTER